MGDVVGAAMDAMRRPAAGRVAVIGAGVIGLTCAWRLAGAGHRVLLLDDGGPAASQVAGGMLAPVSEASFGEEGLARLTLAALRCFPALVADLAGSGHGPVEQRSHGTLTVGLDPDDRLALDRLTAFRNGLGLATEQLSGRTLRRAEPFLSTSASSGVLAVDDLSVDNRQLLTALREAVAAAGVEVVRGRACSFDRDGTRLHGVVLDDGRRIACHTAVLAAGAWSAQVTGLPAHAQPHVVPVKGHILRLRPRGARPSTAYLTRTVRALVHGREVYLVPRADGEVVVGATTEHEGFDLDVRAGAVRGLLDDATAVLPVLDELTLTETATGLRPGTPDNGPLLGWAAPGVLLATGHYRNGLLLSELTAQEVVGRVAGGAASALWSPFDPNRFARSTHPALQEASS